MAEFERGDVLAVIVTECCPNFAGSTGIVIGPSPKQASVPSIAWITNPHNLEEDYGMPMDHYEKVGHIDLPPEPQP